MHSRDLEDTIIQTIPMLNVSSYPHRIFEHKNSSNLLLSKILIEQSFGIFTTVAGCQ